jgi:1-acyl-sn-glycerol-3-phosphate acyltransferase
LIGTWIRFRSALLWVATVLHFFPVGAALVGLGLLVPSRKFDPLVRLFFRNQLRLTGARLRVVRSPALDPRRTCLFVANHINIFDPFVMYSAIPQFVRALELASHFRVPVYGWMMGNFGNIPVPDDNSAEGLRRMTALAREAVASGTSLLVFPEGRRTRTGWLNPFHPGAFRLARELGLPIVPVTQVGSYTLQRVGARVLRPATITVTLHDPIETTGMQRSDERALRDLTWNVVNGPLREAGLTPPGEGPTESPERPSPPAGDA